MKNSATSTSKKFPLSTLTELPIADLTIRYQLIILAGITIFAAVLRFFNLDQWGFWIDEVYTLQRASPVFDSFINGPLLSEVLVGLAVNTWGANEWAARFFPALVGILTIPLIYFLIRYLFDYQVALVSSALLALSPWHLLWSQNARFYTLLLLFYASGLLLFWIGVRTDRILFSILGALLLTLAVRERITAFFFLPVVFSYWAAVILFKLNRPQGFKYKHLFVLALPILFIALSEYLSSLNLYEIDSVDQFAELPEDAETSAFQVFSVLFIGNSLINPVWLFTKIIDSISVPLLCFGIAGGFHLMREKQPIGWFLSLNAIIPFVTIVAISPFVYALDRYIFISFPFWVILAAVGVMALLNAKFELKHIVVLGVVATLILHPLMQTIIYYEYENGGRENWKSAYLFVQQEMKTGDLVFASQPPIGEHYLNEPVAFMNPVVVEEARETNERLWFVDNGWIDPELQAWIHENSQLIGVFDVETDLESFPMRVYLHDPDQ